MHGLNTDERYHDSLPRGKPRRQEWPRHGICTFGLLDSGASLSLPLCSLLCRVLHMRRELRVECPAAVYHGMSCGVPRKDLVLDHVDWLH